jgi:hypothetical protein
MRIGQHRSHMPQVCNPAGQQTFWLFLLHSLQRCLPPSVQVFHFVGQLPSCEQSTQTKLTSLAWPHLPEIKTNLKVQRQCLNQLLARSQRAALAARRTKFCQESFHCTKQSMSM